MGVPLCAPAHTGMLHAVREGRRKQLERERDFLMKKRRERKLMFDFGSRRWWQ